MPHIRILGFAVLASGVASAQSTQPAAATQTAAKPGTQPTTQASTAPSVEGLLWSFATKAPSFGSAAAGDLNNDGEMDIVFGTYFNDEHLYAARARDGKILWKFKSERGPIDTSVLLIDADGDGQLNVLFGDSSTGTLFCLDGDGKPVWKFKGQTSTDSPPAAADLNGDGRLEIVYATMDAGGGGWVNALAAKTGTAIWSARVPGHIQCETALVDLDGDRTLDVLVTNWRGDNKLRALSGADGKELWQFDTGDWIYHGVSVIEAAQRGDASAPSPAPDLIVADRKGSVWRLNGRTGKELWRAKLEGEMDGTVFAPTCVANLTGDDAVEIVVCGLNLHVLDANGKLLWRNAYGAGGRSITRGVAIADLDGDSQFELVFGAGTTLRAVRGDTGRELWSRELRCGSEFHEAIDQAPLILDCDGDGR
ncbi:MAG: PQQ-binding-like beta-propeller repeat protein, partial [Phycisphaerales bacterium]|nr:PQQ-binding-like beta-propeller repeat protein [Phycisphaerales bacterium]